MLRVGTFASCVVLGVMYLAVTQSCSQGSAPRRTAPSTGGNPSPSISLDPNDPNSGCGISLASGVSQPLLSQMLATPEMTKQFRTGAGSAEIRAKGSVDFSGSTQALQIVSNVAFTNAPPPAAKLEAETKLSPYIGQRNVTLSSLSPTDPAWAGIRCSLFGATQIQQTRGGRTSRISFAPAIPYLPSPKQTAARLAKEIPGRLEFQVTATVLESGGDPKLTTQVLPGVVVVEPVAPSLVGRGFQVQAEFAVRMTYNFSLPGLPSSDVPDLVAALGLYTDVTYYFKQSLIEAIVVQTGLSELPQIEYLRGQ